MHSPFPTLKCVRPCAPLLGGALNYWTLLRSTTSTDQLYGVFISIPGGLIVADTTRAERSNHQCVAVPAIYMQCYAHLLPPSFTAVLMRLSLWSCAAGRGSGGH